MKEQPLVSIVIPTYNSEKTLPLCLLSIQKQTYKNIEVIVVDSYSKDSTVKIAEHFGARVIQTHGGLLWARYLGHLYAKGEIEVLLDSDQILNLTAIERSVKMIEKGFDMLILEESSYKPKTIIQWMFYYDRKFVHKIRDLNPIHGVLLARVYKKIILSKTFDEIVEKVPIKILYRAISQDHAIVYYVAWKYSRSVSIVPSAVWHIEPCSLTQMIKKYYRYGFSEFDLLKYFSELSYGKKTPRKFTFSPESWLSIALWLLKAFPYFLGKITTRKISNKNEV